MRLHLLRDEGGSVPVIAAVFAFLMIVLGALVVDVGYLTMQSRRLQGSADLAAIAAATNMPRAEAAAMATAVANGWRNSIAVDVVRGRYVPDPKRPARERFDARGAGTPNAVRVTLTSRVDLFFGRAVVGEGSIQIRRTAVAARPDLAAFSIGSRLAALNGGVANALLSGLTGSAVNLSVMDYNALASAEVDVLAYSRALSSELNLTAGSFDKALDASLTGGQALNALALVLSASGDAQAGRAAGRVAKASIGPQRIVLDRLIDVGPYGAQDYATRAPLKVKAQDLMDAVLLLAAEGRQVKLDLGAEVPGLADVDLWLAIGERPAHSPWMAVAQGGEPVIRTAQTRLYVQAKVAGAGALAEVRVPILIEAASAEARLSRVDCGSGEVRLDVKPGIGTAAIADIDLEKLNDFKNKLSVQPARLISTPVVKATGHAAVALGGVSWKSVRFSSADIAASKVKTVSTDDLVQGVAASLVKDVDLKVGVLGLGLSAPPLTKALGETLGAAAGPLDALIGQLSDLTGVRLGRADVKVEGTRCGAAALVV